MAARLAAVFCTGLLVSVAAAWGSRPEAQPAPQPASLSARIDAELAAVWKRDGIAPAPLSDDAEFLRRVHLVLVGEPPTRAQVLAFLADASPGKRAALIDALLADPRYGEHLADLWMPILREQGSELQEFGDAAGDVLAVWLAARFNADAGFDEIVRAIVTAEGSISQSPPAAYYALMGLPPKVADAAGLTVKHFAGIQIQCAQCHDHPYEKAWTEPVFAGVASFFAPLEITADFTAVPVDPGVKHADLPPRQALEAYAATREAQENPDIRRRVLELLAYDKPQFPGDKPVRTRDADALPAMAAGWINSPRNRTALRYQVNRFWAFLWGYGLVNPVDDFNSFSEPSHPALLDALADDFAANGRSAKRLARAVLNSDAWQATSRGQDKRALPWHFAAYPVRQLTPEELFGSLFALAEGDSLQRVFLRQNPDAIARLRQFAALLKQQPAQPDAPRFDLKRLEAYEAHLDAMRPAWRLRRALGRKYAALAAEDVRSGGVVFGFSLDQALSVLNGDITRRLGGSQNGSAVFAVMRDCATPETRVEALFTAVLARKPAATELQRLTGFVQAEVAAGRTEAAALEDVFFALAGSTEFATNH